MKLFSRPSHSSTRTAGRWRRIVLVLGVMAVTLVLWVRNQRIESFREQVVAEVRALIDLVEQGAVPGDPDPVRALLSGAAWIEIDRLEGPVVPGPVLVDADADAEALVLVTGDAGGRVLLAWQGNPPILVSVERLDVEDTFELLMEEPSQ